MECFKCHRPGHWAKDCDTRPCPKCRVGLHLHTEAGIVECAWRGRPCSGCGFPPHPDGAPGRCTSYSSDEDTAAGRELRSRTAWHRSADPDSFYRRGSHIPPAGPDPAGDLGPWRARAEELMANAATAVPAL